MFKVSRYHRTINPTPKAMQTTTHPPDEQLEHNNILQYMEEQSQQFDNHRSHLLQTHPNQFIWFESGQVLDADTDFATLCDRVLPTHRPTFIRQVLPEDPQPQVRTPLRSAIG
jgi:hypothetical protein